MCLQFFMVDGWLILMISLWLTLPLRVSAWYISHTTQPHCVDKKWKLWQDRGSIPTKCTRISKRPKKCGTVVKNDISCGAFEWGGTILCQMSNVPSLFSTFCSSTCCTVASVLPYMLTLPVEGIRGNGWFRQYKELLLYIPSGSNFPSSLAFCSIGKSNRMIPDPPVKIKSTALESTLPSHYLGNPVLSCLLDTLRS